MKRQKIREFTGKKGYNVGIVSKNGHIGPVANNYEYVALPFNVELDGATLDVVATDTIETKVISMANTNSVHFNTRMPDNLDDMGLIKITVAAIPYVATAWSGGQAKTQGAIVVPTTGEDGLYYVCTTAGTTHAITEPTWPDEAGETVTDNDVVWTAISSAEVSFEIKAKIFSDTNLVKQTGDTKVIPVVYAYPADATDGAVATVQSVYIKASDLNLLPGEYYNFEVIRKAITYSAGHYELKSNVGVVSLTFEFSVE